MELWKIIIFCLVVLVIVAGGYVFIFFHIMRRDPKESEYRKHIGQDDRLIPPKNKNNTLSTKK